jgi:hypothetical protein
MSEKGTRLVLVVLGAMLTLAAEIANANAIDTALIYRNWFLSKDESTARKFQFRLYSNEVGTARNIFALTCDGDAPHRATVELLPPTSLKDDLQELGSSDLAATRIRITAGQTVLLSADGEFDRIAAFLDFSGEKELFEFLKMVASFEKLTVTWDEPKLEYLILYSPVYADQFKSLFLERLKSSNFEEMTFQDVHLKCSGLF